MSEKEPPKAPVAPEERFQLLQARAPLTAEQKKQQQLAAAAKHKQLVEQGDGESSGEGSGEGSGMGVDMD